VNEISARTISIIIVNYKVPLELADCIQSISDASDVIPSEIIVVDNASLDDSQSIILERFPKIRWIQNDRNYGFAAAVNRGLESSTGTIVLLINPDARIRSGSLDAFRRFFESRSEAGIVGGRVLNPDGSLQAQCRRNIPALGPAFFRLFGLSRWFPMHQWSSGYEMSKQNSNETQTIEAVSGAFMAFRKVLVSEIGFMDDGFFLFGEDLDYCYRSILAGKSNYYLPEAIATHERGASRKKRPLRTTWHIHQAMHRFYKKHQAEFHNPVVNLAIYFVIWFRWFIMNAIELTSLLTSTGKMI
jgi:O-antigen biosynthesis protein